VSGNCKRRRERSLGFFKRAAAWSWPCENFSATRARRTSRRNCAMESNRAVRTMFDTLSENCIFYFSQLYEFSHKLCRGSAFIREPRDQTAHFGLSLPPPPAEQATARQDQARKSCASNRAR
jgi:hypothetical protein